MVGSGAYVLGVRCSVCELAFFFQLIDISTSILQHIAPGAFGIENICLIHENCKHLYICITEYSPRGIWNRKYLSNSREL